MTSTSFAPFFTVAVPPVSEVKYGVPKKMLSLKILIVVEALPRDGTSNPPAKVATPLTLSAPVITFCAKAKCRIKINKSVCYILMLLLFLSTDNEHDIKLKP